MVVRVERVVRETEFGGEGGNCDLMCRVCTEGVLAGFAGGRY